MDRIALGLRIRALRIRAALRRSDLALAAGVPRRTIGELENGTFAHVSVDQLVRVGASLRATVDVRIRWHGEDLDRLIDAAHAATVAAVLERLRAWKWEALVEVSFAIWGERGSIDALAWHAPSRSLLVIEVKSVLPDLQATLRDLDRKTRLGPAIAQGARLAARACRSTSRPRRVDG
jgi:DNA-binding XRE family transcriptional regulator